MIPGPDRKSVRRAAAVAAALLAVTILPPNVTFADSELAPGKLLVASRDLDDPNFSRTVVLLTGYGQEGAIGLVINRPAAILPEQVLPEVDGLAQYSGPLFLGGPVEVHQILFLVKTSAPVAPGRMIFDAVYLSGSRTLLSSLSRSPTDASRLRIYAGYAGWAPGQLEREILAGGWHVIPATEAIVFSDDPESVWEQAVPRPEPIIAGLGTASSFLPAP